MKPILWDNSKMNLGIKLIDEQHKHLFKITNLLATTITKTSEKKDILYILNKLIDYAKFHFTSEEALFDKVNYTDSNEHKKEHSEFINQFKEAQSKLKKDSSFSNLSILDIAENTYEYIVKWIIKHILGSDKKYVNLVHQKKLTVKLKDLTVLYVDDNDEVRTYFSKILKLKVKNVYTFSEGESALNFFKEKKADIDLIISDIEMPQMNGITLLKEIRAIDEQIPYIISSAFKKPEYLIDSITYHVTAYLLKPIDVTELFSKIDYIFYEKVDKVKSHHQKIQIETYLDALNSVALVTKTDLEGTITYVNDMCCKVFKYKREELISTPYRSILDPHLSKEKIDRIKEIIRSGNKWHGQIKHEGKDKTSFYTVTTIFPLYENEDNDISGYFVINFLVTDFVEEKREFKKNIISSIVDYKKDKHCSLKKISFLEESLLKANDEILFYQEEKDMIDSKYKKVLNQINFYEESTKEKDSQYKKNLETYKVNFEKINNIYKNLSNETKRNRQDISKLKEEELIKAKEIYSLNTRLNDQAKIIIGLRDTINNIK